MTLAIIKTGGKQYAVSPGQKLQIEKLPGDSGSEIIFDQILLTAVGDQAQIGRPLVVGAKVKATVLEQGRRKKITIQKFKSKSNYRVKRGHRQLFTRVEINEISA